MADPFIAEIRMFGGNYAPKSWAFCNGQLMPIAQNTALFSILGTQYGGDGKTIFGLPNLQGRVPVGQGQGPGLTNRYNGDTGGETSVTLTSAQMPAHTHSIMASANRAGTNSTPGTDQKLAKSGGGSVYSSANPNMAFTPNGLSPAGGSQPHNNVQPYLAVTFIIALYGDFPPRQ